MRIVNLILCCGLMTNPIVYRLLPNNEPDLQRFTNEKDNNPADENKSKRVTIIFGNSFDSTFSKMDLANGIDYLQIHYFNENPEVYFYIIYFEISVLKNSDEIPLLNFVRPKGGIDSFEVWDVENETFILRTETRLQADSIYQFNGNRMSSLLIEQLLQLSLYSQIKIQVKIGCPDCVSRSFSSIFTIVE